MRNAGLEEAQAGIKIAGRNTNNLRYADDTTLMAESEKELKSLSMKVKESEKVGLKLNIQKTKIAASGQSPGVLQFSHWDWPGSRSGRGRAEMQPVPALCPAELSTEYTLELLFQEGEAGWGPDFQHLRKKVAKNLV